MPMTAFEFGQQLAKNAYSPLAERLFQASLLREAPARTVNKIVKIRAGKLAQKAVPVAAPAVTKIVSDKPSLAWRMATSTPVLGGLAAAGGGAYYGYNQDYNRPLTSAAVHAALAAPVGLGVGALASRALPRLFR